MSFTHRRAHTRAGEWVAPGCMRLRVKRGVWQLQRRVCLDAQGLALKGMWEPRGPSREVVCEREVGELVARVLRAAGHEVDVLDGGPA